MNRSPVDVLAPTALAAALAAALPAQMQAGEIAVTGLSTNAFGIVTPPSTTATAYVTTGFGGAGAGTTRSILHWRNLYNQFFVGGVGFVGRATVTGSGAVTWTPVTTAIGEAAQLSWDSVANVVVADAGTDQLRLVAWFGGVTELSTGPQPWGSDLSAGAFDPRTGDVIAGGNGALYRLAAGTSTAVTVASGLGGAVSAVAFDPANGDVLASVRITNRLVRLGPNGLVTDLVPPGTVTAPSALDVDLGGALIVGGTGGAIWRVPIGGPATLLATNTSPSTDVTSVSVVKFHDYAGVMYTACAAANGPSSLSSLGPWQPGATFRTRSVNHAPNAIGVVNYGLSDLIYLGQPLPLLVDPLLGTSNCWLNVAPDVTFVAIADGAGVMTHALTATAAFAGYRVYSQHVVLENVPGGFSFSNGAYLQF
jgi:hypothetical protein